MTAVATCISDKNEVSLPCTACFAQGASCKHQPDPSFEAKDVACVNYYYKNQQIALADELLKITKEYGTKNADLLDQLTKGTITPEQYAKKSAALDEWKAEQTAINSALNDQCMKLAGACPFADCKAQGEVCTGNSSAEDVSTVIA